MNVDPTHAAAMQAPVANEGDDLAVRNDFRRVHALIGVEQLLAAASIADQEFSIDQLVPYRLVQA